jgi:hypothetical protein
MVVLDTVEFAFEFPYLGAISIYHLVGAIPIFVDLVDYKHGVTIHHEAFNAELYGYTETV